MANKSMSDDRMTRFSWAELFERAPNGTDEETIQKRLAELRE